MSPEQSWGAKIDARSDIYSLGCCMFEALTGLTPFIAKNAVQVIMMHQNSPPPSLAQTAPDKTFDDSIEQVIRVMLAKNPDHRYQSMDDLAQDLILIKSGKQPRFAQAQEKFAGQESNLTSANQAAKAITPITLSQEKIVAKVTPKSSKVDDTGGEISDNTFDQLSESQTVTTKIWKKFNYHALALAAILVVGTIGILSELRPNQPANEK
jgi:serine/threonine protein kinase